MVKKALLGFIIVGVVVAVFGTAGLVYAQSIGPTATQAPQSGFGFGMGSGFGRGMRGGMGIARNSTAGTQAGFMHDEMLAAFAQKLGMSTADLNTLLAQGQTMAQIGASKGYTAEQFAALWSEAHSLALDQAVKDGKITQAQADWMKTRGAGMTLAPAPTPSRTVSSGRAGVGLGAGGRGMMSGGGFGNANCPYFSQSSQ